MSTIIKRLALGYWILAGILPAHADTAAPEDSELAEIVVRANRLHDVLREMNRRLDEARDGELLPTLGASSYTLDQQSLEALPQGKNTPLDKVLLQAPGVSYDSAISNPDFHVRNEYANVQYRINGIALPDGVSALGSVLETGFVGNLNLLDGVLPAQYGLRTAGVVDITSKERFDGGGNLDVYGGSLGTVSPSIEAGGAVDATQYFLTGRYLESAEGLENATPSVVPIHDHTTQEKFFGYGSTLFGDSVRLTTIAGAFVGHFQIPNVIGATPLGDVGPATLSSASLDEHEADRFYFGLLALQTHDAALDTQLSVFTRYASVDFVPDLVGDLAFNDVASTVVRKSLLSGVEFDVAERLGASQVLRAGITFSLEQTRVDDLSAVLPLDADGHPLPTPVTVNDADSKRGETAGAYLQDEWTLRPDLVANLGVRFDQMNQFVAANQTSPRLALEYTPLAGTSLHAGVARYFTPPMQAQATPTTLALFQNTTQQPAIPLEDPVRPERATYFDVGVDRHFADALSVGVDLYYKRSTDTLDDGQFGQAVVLTQFNYAQGFSRGAEFKLTYQRGGLRIYANLADEATKVKNVVSNQFLIGDPAELAFLAGAYTYASDAQTISASTGLSYQWRGLLASIDGIYGSGLRTGFANLAHTPDYTQWNAAIAERFRPWARDLPLTVRVSAVNLFDKSYLLRSGDGIGEFAPQYGPRREIFIEFTQQF